MNAIAPAFNHFTLKSASWWISISILGLMLNAACAGQFGLITYTDEGSTITITDIPDDVVGEMVIPEVIIGKPVTRIGEFAFANCAALTSVTLPDSVTSIGSSGFVSCTAMVRVNMSHQVADIGEWAFAYCTSLTGVLIPATVIDIREYAFAYCNSLTEVYFTGDQPILGHAALFTTASGLTVYYFDGKAEFTFPTWLGNQSVNMGVKNSMKLWLIDQRLPYNSDPTGDPDNDGVSLLVAYALGLNPSNNPIGQLPQVQLAGESMSLRFHAGKKDVDYRVETSTDLRNWSAEGVMLSGPDGDGFRVGTVAVDEPNRFMRLALKLLSN